MVNVAARLPYTSVRPDFSYLMSLKRLYLGQRDCSWMYLLHFSMLGDKGYGR